MCFAYAHRCAHAPCFAHTAKNNSCLMNVTHLSGLPKEMHDVRFSGLKRHVACGDGAVGVACNISAAFNNSRRLLRSIIG